MSAPNLNRKLLLQAPVRTPDGAGGYDLTWQDLGIVWAAIKPGSGRETGGVAVTMSRVPVRITVRAYPFDQSSRPKPDQRFVEGARIYVIIAVTDSDPARRYVTCHALEEVAA